jgi:hypothetical protein
MKSNFASIHNERFVNLHALVLLIFSIYGFFVFFDGISSEEGPNIYERYFWKWHSPLVFAICANLAAIGLYLKRSFGWIIGLAISITSVLEGIRLLAPPFMNDGSGGLDWIWFVLAGFTFAFFVSSFVLLAKHIRNQFDIKKMDYFFTVLVLMVLILDNLSLRAFLFG